MFTAGAVVYAGYLFIMLKLPRKAQMWLLGHSLILDVLVSSTAYLMHRGTYTGVMVAAIAGVLCAVTTWMARYAIGYTRGQKYHPGQIWTVNPT